jgi:hypothetical protein
MARLNEFNPGVIQPGMERIVEAGETLEITDNQGQVFAVTGTECEATMTFIKKFDVWKMMNESSMFDQQKQLAWHECLQAFNHLPLRVQRQLPSFKSLGVKA